MGEIKGCLHYFPSTLFEQCLSMHILTTDIIYTFGILEVHMQFFPFLTLKRVENIDLLISQSQLCHTHQSNPHKSSCHKHSFTKQAQLLPPSFSIGTTNTAPGEYADNSHWILLAPGEQREGGMGNLSPPYFFFPVDGILWVRVNGL